MNIAAPKDMSMPGFIRQPLTMNEDLIYLD